MFQQVKLLVLNSLVWSSSPRASRCVRTSQGFPVAVIGGPSGPLVPDLQVFALHALEMLQQLAVVHLGVGRPLGGGLLLLGVGVPGQIGRAHV